MQCPVCHSIGNLPKRGKCAGGDLQGIPGPPRRRVAERSGRNLWAVAKRLCPSVLRKAPSAAPESRRQEAEGQRPAGSQQRRGANSACCSNGSASTTASRGLSYSLLPLGNSLPAAYMGVIYMSCSASQTNSRVVWDSSGMREMRTRIGTCTRSLAGRPRVCFSIGRSSSLPARRTPSTSLDTRPWAGRTRDDGSHSYSPYGEPCSESSLRET